MTSINNVQFLTGNVVEFFDIDWRIKFRIPGLLDDLDDYPIANPLLGHIIEVKKDDEVFILRPDIQNNNTFFYLPVSIYREVKLENKTNLIDLTEKGRIKINTGELTIVASDKINLLTTVGKLIIDSNGNIKVSGDLIANGMIGSQIAYTGKFCIPGVGMVDIENGIIKSIG